MLFEFKIYYKEMIKINKSYITNTDNINKCKFYFDKHTWQDKTIFVTFLNENGYGHTVILGQWAEVLSCNIPSNITKGQYFKIFAYAKDLFKTNMIKVYTQHKSSYVSKKSQHAIDYLIKQLDTKIDNLAFENHQLKCYSNGELIDTVYIDNDIDEAVVQHIVDNHLSDITVQLEARINECITCDDLDSLILNL